MRGCSIKNDKAIHSTMFNNEGVNISTKVDIRAIDGTYLPTYFIHKEEYFSSAVLPAPFSIERYICNL